MQYGYRAASQTLRFIMCRRLQLHSFGSLNHAQFYLATTQTKNIVFVDFEYAKESSNYDLGLKLTIYNYNYGS